MRTGNIVLKIKNHNIVRVMTKTSLHYEEIIYFNGEQVYRHQYKTFIGKFIYWLHGEK